MLKAILILVVGILFYTGYQGYKKTQVIPKRDLSEINLDQKMLIEDLLREAKTDISKRMENDENLTSGPCLLNPSTIDDDWVIDMAHDPINEDDKKIENQCSMYVKGVSKHFIEVDSKGNLLRFN